MALDLGQLLRYKGMVEAASTAVDADGAAAHALSESYMRLREQLANVLEGDLSDEFNAVFPEIEIPAPVQVHPGAAARAAIAQTPAARRAQVLLTQLAGWLDGLIAEQTLDQRLKLEAAERVAQERRKPPGFGA
jgi:hypothetical protein